MSLLKTILKWRWMFNIVITIVLLVYLLMTIKIDRVINAIASINLLIALFSLPLIFLGYLIKAEKWRLFLKIVDVDISTLASFKLIIIGTFYGLITPGKAGEFVRSLYIGEKKSIIIPTILIDRAIDIVWLVILSFISAAIFFNDATILLLIAITAIIFFFGIWMITNKKILLLFNSVFKNKALIENYTYTTERILSDKSSLMKNFLWTGLHYTISFAMFWVILKALNPTLNDCIVLSQPIILMVSNLPISISGIGVREFVTVKIFSFLNEDQEFGFAYSIILFSMGSLLPALLAPVFILTGGIGNGAKNRDN